MSDTARDIQTVDQLSTEGLDGIFAPEAIASRNPGEPVAQSIRRDLDTLAQGLSFKDACDYYGVKPTALRSRIKSGKIVAEKIEGPNGPEWRVYPGAVPQPQRDPGEALAIPLHDQAETVAQPVRDSIDGRLLDMVDDLQSKLDKANRELQAATYRVGYLENQVSERERDIQELDTTLKLLTDSQHKPSWWQQFKAFFVKS